MTRERPTLAELRMRAQKRKHREIGNFLARRYARPTAIYGTWLAVRLGLSAHQITLAAWGAFQPSWMVQARTSCTPAVK